MSNQVSDFQRHFGASARGLIPFNPGFTIVGKVGTSRRLAQKSNLPQPSNALVSITPAVAAVEQAASLVGGGKQKRTRKPTKKNASAKTKKYRKRKPKVKKKLNHSKKPKHRKEAL